MISLHKAIKTKKTHLVLPLVKSYNFNGFYFLEGEYILPLLLIYKHYEALEYLLEDKSINIDYKDIYGNTLIYHAMRQGESEWVEKLIERGADIQIKNNNGLTLISEAIMSRKYELVSLLIEKGYKIENIDVELIIKGNHIDLLKYIPFNNINKDLLFFTVYRKNNAILMEYIKKDLSLLLMKNKSVRLIDYIQSHNMEAYTEIVALLVIIQIYVYVAINANIISVRQNLDLIIDKKAA